MPPDPKPTILTPETKDSFLNGNNTDQESDNDSEPADSFLARFIIPPSAYETRGVCFGFVAPAGAGKTTLAGANIESEEYGGRTMIVDVEAGSKVLDVNNPLYTIVRMTKWSEIDQLTSRFIAGKYPEFKGVVLDNLCEIQKAHLASVAKPGEEQIQHWRQNTETTKYFVRRWRDYADANNVNVFFTAWDDEEEKRNLTPRLSVQSTPSFQKEFPGLLDNIGFINKINNRPDLRELDFTPSMNNIMKMRRAKNSNAMKLPYKIRYDVDHLPLADILAVLKGGKAWPTEKYSQFERKSNE